MSSVPRRQDWKYRLWRSSDKGKHHEWKKGIVDRIVAKAKAARTKREDVERIVDERWRISIMLRKYCLSILLSFRQQKHLQKMSGRYRTTDGDARRQIVSIDGCNSGSRDNSSLSCWSVRSSIKRNNFEIDLSKIRTKLNWCSSLWKDNLKLRLVSILFDSFHEAGRRSPGNPCGVF